MSTQFVWREVDSSNVAKIAYLAHSQAKSLRSGDSLGSESPQVPRPQGAGDLFVTFKNGGVYRYFGVPSTTFASMCRGDLSVGRFLNAHVKAQGIRYLKLSDSEVPS